MVFAVLVIGLVVMQCRIGKTLAEKHQCFQAYMSTGSMLPHSVTLKNSSPFCATDYSEQIQEAVLQYECLLQDTVVTHEVVCTGTVYKRDLCVLVCDDDGQLIVGCIKLILVHRSESVYLLVELFQPHFLPFVGCFDVHYSNALQHRFRCIPLESLLDYQPLPCYGVTGHQLLPLKHMYCRKL